MPRRETMRDARALFPSISPTAAKLFDTFRSECGATDRPNDSSDLQCSGGSYEEPIHHALQKSFWTVAGEEEGGPARFLVDERHKESLNERSGRGRPLGLLAGYFNFLPSLA